MKNITILLWFLSGIIAYAQISLEQCYEALQKNFPALQTQEHLQRLYNLEIEKINNNWLPQINLNAFASYQSDVTQVDVVMPQIQIPGSGQSFQLPNLNIPTPDKDQYKINFELSQMLYDGGLISAKKSLQKSNFDLNSQNIEIKLQDLKTKVNQIFFGIIALDKSISLIDLTLASLNEKRKVLESLVENGVLLNTELKNFDSEVLKIEQQKIEMTYNRITLIKSLSLLTGLNLDNNTKFNLPNSEIVQKDKYSSPMYKLFEYQKKIVESSNSLKQVMNYPKVYAFAQIGYGKPGLNMLSDEFSPFYILGIQLKWNIWDWNATKKENQTAEINNNLIDKSKESYDLQLQIDLENELMNINKIEKIIENNEEIVALKSEIVKSSNSKLKNGIIKSADYINDVNDELKSKIELEINKIKKLQSIINYNTLLGK